MLLVPRADELTPTATADPAEYASYPIAVADCPVAAGVADVKCVPMMVQFVCVDAPVCVPIITVLLPAVMTDAPMPIVPDPLTLADVPSEIAPTPAHCVLSPMAIQFVPLPCPESPRTIAPAADDNVFFPIAIAAVISGDVVADDPIAMLSDAPAEDV